MKRTLIGLLAWAAVATVVEAQTVGTCAPAMAETYLDVGNVRARIFNSGRLFERDPEHPKDDGYLIPRESSINALRVANLWVGGLVDGELRMSGSEYGSTQFWPGPLDADGQPPPDCTPFDHLYRISRSDVETFESTGVATEDLASWPTGLGAPTVDASGHEIDLSDQPLAVRLSRRLDLAAGERPAFVGDQMVWWVMNDAGNEKAGWDQTAQIPIEVHGLAFAFDEPGHVGNTTFLRYRIFNRGQAPVEDAFLGMHVHASLGRSVDNWMGSDPALNLGFALNADNDDESVIGSGPSPPVIGYGPSPPAIGIDLLEGPIVASPGHVAHVQGREVPDFRNLQMTALAYFRQLCGVAGCFDSSQAQYYLLQGRWSDGQPFTYGGNGRDFSSTPTSFMFPGDVAQCGYWSECNADDAGNRISQGERSFVLASGPFTIEPAGRQEVLFSLVYGRGSDNLDSVTELKTADEAIQRFVDSRFTVFPTVQAAPTAVPGLVSPSDLAQGQPLETTLWWECPAGLIHCNVVVASDPGFEFVVASSRETELSIDLEPETTYWWKARGYGRNDLPGHWSEVRSFRTGSRSLQNRIVDFQVVANGSGPLDPPECAALGSAGFPLVDCGRDRPDGSRQQVAAALTANQGWVIHAGGAKATFGPSGDTSSFLARSFRNEAPSKLGAYDYEMRFKSSGGKAKRAFQDGGVMEVPFELWRVGRGTLDDPSDDVRLVPFVNDLHGQFAFDIGGDHAVSAGPDDPITDWIYWNLPADDSPGDAGYRAYFDSSRPAAVTELIARTVLVCLDCGTTAPYPQPYPEAGTVFRIVTSPPEAPILAAPASGPVIRGSDLRFFWTAADGFPVMLQVSISPGFETFVARFPEAEPGITLRLAEPGEYYWRVGSDFAGWSETWVSNVVSLTGIDDAADLPTEYTLDSIWPNPFNPLATIRFGLPADAVATVDVVDVLGRRVAVIDAGARRAAGWHTVQFDGSRLSSGVYFVRLVAGGRLDVKSVVLLK